MPTSLPLTYIAILRLSGGKCCCTGLFIIYNNVSLLYYALIDSLFNS